MYKPFTNLRVYIYVHVCARESVVALREAENTHSPVPSVNVVDSSVRPCVSVHARKRVCKWVCVCVYVDVCVSFCDCRG